MKKNHTLCFLLLFCSLINYSQIQYVDFTDVTLTSGQQTNIDFDNDAINDLRVINSMGTTLNIGVFYNSTGTSTMQTAMQTGVLTRRFAVNQNITPTGYTYTTNSSGGIGIMWSNTYWYNLTYTDFYVGIKFTKVSSGTIHYGWIKADAVISGNNLVSLTLKEMAWNQTANTAILAGQTVLSNEDFQFSNLKTYPNPTKNNITIDIQENATATLFDLLGKQILTKKLQIGENTLDTSNFEKGIYLVKIENEKGSKTIKLVKE